MRQRDRKLLRQANRPADLNNDSPPERLAGGFLWPAVFGCDILFPMSQQVDAIYDSGVLRPLEPLAVPDQARVRLTIEAQTGSESVEETTGVNEGESGGQLTGAELLKLASVHAPPPEFCEADEDRPW